MDAKPVDHPPHSTENYDGGALLPEQQKRINELKVSSQVLPLIFAGHCLSVFKIQKRIENERYLQKHPELNVLLRDFLRQTCLQKPEDIRQFAAGESWRNGTFISTFIFVSLSTRLLHPSNVRKTNRPNHP